MQGGHIVNSTRLAYERVVRVHLLPPRREGGLGDLRLQAVTVRHVDDLLAAKLDAGYAPRTVQAILHVLRIGLNKAVKKDMLARSVATLADPPSVRRPKVVSLTPEVASAVLAKLRGDRLEALYTVALALGLRLGEALGLGWDAVDLEAGSVRLHRNLKRERGRWVFGDTKTHADVTLPLPASAVAALRAHRTRQRAERLAAPMWHEPEVDLVFRRQDGQPIFASSINHLLNAACDAADVARITPHQFARHGAATLLRQQGAALEEIRDLLRHARIGTTADIYAHVNDELRRGHGRPDGGPPRRDTPTADPTRRETRRSGA